MVHGLETIKRLNNPVQQGELDYEQQYLLLEAQSQAIMEHARNLLRKCPHKYVFRSCDGKQIWIRRYDHRGRILCICAADGNHTHPCAIAHYTRRSADDYLEWLEEIEYVKRGEWEVAQICK